MRAGLTFALLALVGCSDSQPDTMYLSFGTYSTTPVMLLAFTINEQSANLALPAVQQGNAELSPIRTTSGSIGSDWPGDRSVAQISATWVELRTNRAYSASAAVDTADLPRTPASGEAAEVKAVFGPHGLMILAGEETGANPVPRDLAETCGTRRPDSDTDFSTQPLAHAGLTEVLQISYLPVAVPTTCPEPDR